MLTYNPSAWQELVPVSHSDHADGEGMQAVMIVDCRQNRSCPRRRWPETLLTELEQQLSGLFDAALGSTLGSALGEAPDFTLFENGLVGQRIAHAPNPRHQLVGDGGRKT